MASPSFWDHPIEKLEEALNLKKQIHALQAKLSSLFGGDDEEATPAPAKRKPGRPPKSASPVAPVKRGPGRPPKSASPVASAPTQPTKRGRKPFSAETKAKMAAAQRARWARKSGAGGTVILGPSPKRAKTGKRTMSPEARARIAAAQRARWAKQKAR